MNISFRNLEDSDNDYNKLFNWCKNDFIYKWFEQRKLTKEETVNKYRNKILSKKQELLIINYNDKDIGLVQIYKCENDNRILNKYNNVYEFDIFIGEEDYLSKGLGEKIVNLIKDKIYLEYNADAIVLRPFKENIRAIKCYEKANFKVVGEYQDKDTIGNAVTTVLLVNEKRS